MIFRHCVYRYSLNRMMSTCKNKTSFSRRFSVIRILTYTRDARITLLTFTHTRTCILEFFSLTMIRDFYVADKENDLDVRSRLVQWRQFSLRSLAIFASVVHLCQRYKSSSTNQFPDETRRCTMYTSSSVSYFIYRASFIELFVRTFPNIRIVRSTPHFDNKYASLTYFTLDYVKYSRFFFSFFF